MPMPQISPDFVIKALAVFVALTLIGRFVLGFGTLDVVGYVDGQLVSYYIYCLGFPLTFLCYDDAGGLMFLPTDAISLALDLLLVCLLVFAFEWVLGRRPKRA